MAGDTRERMIHAAARLLQQKGYHGTSLSEILAESEAPRGSLYFHFPGGKDQLVLEATRASVEMISRWLRELLADSRDAAQGARAFAEGAAAIVRDSNYTLGCPVSPLVLDGTETFDELASLCKEAVEEWLAILTDAFVAGGVPRERAQSLAVFVESTVEGSLLLARTYRDPRPLMEVAPQLEQAVNAAIAEARPRKRSGAAGGADQAAS